MSGNALLNIYDFKMFHIETRSNYQQLLSIEKLFVPHKLYDILKLIQGFFHFMLLIFNKECWEIHK